MRHTVKSFIALVLISAVFIFAVFFLLRWTAFFGKNLPDDASFRVHADDIMTASLPDGRNLITDVTARYRFTLGYDWYFEKNIGTGVTVYPDYDPRNNGVPLCKIQISSFPNLQDADLDTWLKAYFKEDPTANIEQQSLAGSELSGHAAITWAGTENGASTTLVYVAGDHAVYEIVPSIVEGGNSDTSKSAGFCKDALESLLETFKPLP